MINPYDLKSQTANSSQMFPDITPKAPSMQFPVASGTAPSPQPAAAPVVAPKPVAPTIASAYKAPQTLSTSGTAKPSPIVAPIAPVVAPAVTPTSVATPASTVTTTGLGGMQGNIKDIYGDASFYNDRNSWLANQGVTEAAEKAGLADEMQRQINASNALYAEKLRQAKVAGEARLGGTMARNQSRGAVGGSFGSAAVETEQFANQDIYNTIEQEKAAAEGAIRAGISNLAKKYYEDKRSAAEAGYKERIAFKKSEGEYGDAQANAAVEYLIANNSTPESITDKDAKDAGTTLEKIKKAFLVKKYETTQAETKRKQEITDKQAEEQFKADLKAKEGFALSEGQVRYDSNGKRIAFNPKTYKDDTLSASGTPLTAEGKQSKLNQLTNLKNLATKVESLADRSGSDTLWEGIKKNVGGATSYSNLVAQTNSLRVQAMTVLADPNNKKFFGPAMSNADVQLMMAGGNPINPELQTPEEMRESLANLVKAVDEIETNIKNGTVGAVEPITPAAAVSQINHNGIIYNVDANGDLTPAN